MSFLQNASMQSKPVSPRATSIWKIVNLLVLDALRREFLNHATLPQGELHEPAANNLAIPIRQ